MRPWGFWHASGGQLASCGGCDRSVGVVLLPRFRYAMVDAVVGVWHASAHALPVEVPPSSVPTEGSRDLPAEFGAEPLSMLGHWCAVARWLDRHEPDARDVAAVLRFLLAYREEELVVPAERPIPKGGYETENPDRDVAPDAYRLHGGVSLADHLARHHGSACWAALEAAYVDLGPAWVPRMDQPRGHNLLAPLFLRSPMPPGMSPSFVEFVGGRFPRAIRA